MARGGGSRMKKPCDCCQRYLDYLDEKNQSMSCFLRRMTANSKHSMIIPNRFLKHFARKLSGTIKLESPNGSLYDVEVTEHFNKVVLRHGWKAFVDAHNIEENDSVLFRNIGNSVFEVLILDSDGCEKMFCCAGIRNTPSVGERSVHSLDISSSSQHDTTETSGSERVTRCLKGSSSRRGKTSKMAVISSSSSGSGEDIPSENEYFDSDEFQENTPLGADYSISCRSHLTKEQKERVIALIQEIQPEITIYTAVMRKSHVHPKAPYAAITKKYASAHLHGDTNVTLQRPGESKKWHPKFYIRKDRSVYRLRGQWLDFVRDNHVQEGDICLFLPTNGGRRFTFTVYLLRAKATHSRHVPGFECVGPSAKVASEVHIKEEPTDGDHVSSESDMHEISHESVESEDPGGPSQPLYILPSKSRLSKSQKKIVEERVRAIQCDVPIYVAIMRKGSIAISPRTMLELGSRYVTAVHLPARGQTMVLQCMRKIWKTKMVIHHGCRRFLSGGWLKFVGDNGVRVGDICLFELKKNERKLTMKVHIISREQLLACRIK